MTRSCACRTRAERRRYAAIGGAPSPRGVKVMPPQSEPLFGYPTRDPIIPVEYPLVVGGRSGYAKHAFAAIALFVVPWRCGRRWRGFAPTTPTSCTRRGALLKRSPSTDARSQCAHAALEPSEQHGRARSRRPISRACAGARSVGPYAATAAALSRRRASSERLSARRRVADQGRNDGAPSPLYTTPPFITNFTRSSSVMSRSGSPSTATMSA